MLVSLSNFKVYMGLGILAFLILSLLIRAKKPSTPIWSIMAFTSFISVASGLMDLDGISSAIDMDVILFLIGMFILVSLAETSGLLDVISFSLLSKFRTRSNLVIASSLLFGLLSAFAANDTIALMGPPIAYAISKLAGLDPKVMFLLLAYSITIGSVMTPLGNPQNVLIALQSGMKAPFVNFISRLALPTLINLIITPLVIMKLYKIENIPITTGIRTESITLRNKKDAFLSGIGLLVSILALLVNDMLEIYGLNGISHKGFIPFVIAAGVCFFVTDPRDVLSHVDWGTIVFFITMFITMDGIWNSGAIQPLLHAVNISRSAGVCGILQIVLISVLLSQLLSNVPFVKLFMKYMKSFGYAGEDTNAWLALAMSSTIAGNLTILGAASNVIILERLSSRMNYTITFSEFLRVGSIITVLNILIYLPFILT